jgi:hypothetical protein
VPTLVWFGLAEGGVGSRTAVKLTAAHRMGKPHTKSVWVLALGLASGSSLWVWALGIGAKALSIDCGGALEWTLAFVQMCGDQSQ